MSCQLVMPDLSYTFSGFHHRYVSIQLVLQQLSSLDPTAATGFIVNAPWRYRPHPPPRRHSYPIPPPLFLSTNFGRCLSDSGPYPGLPVSMALHIYLSVGTGWPDLMSWTAMPSVFYSSATCLGFVTSPIVIGRSGSLVSGEMRSTPLWHTEAPVAHCRTR